MSDLDKEKTRWAEQREAAALIRLNDALDEASKLRLQISERERIITNLQMEVSAKLGECERLTAEWHDMDDQRKELIIQKHAAVAELDAANRLNERMKIRLEQIVESDDTTRMTGEQILMGYNANKDLARAALTEMQYPEKRNDKHQCICDPGRRSAYCKAHV